MNIALITIRNEEFTEYLTALSAEIENIINGGTENPDEALNAAFNAKATLENLINELDR